MQMNNFEKISKFLSEYCIEKPTEGCNIGYMHSYSLWIEYKKWVKANKLSKCDHNLFLLLLYENGFKLTSESEIHLIVNADILTRYALWVPFKSRYGFENKENRRAYISKRKINK
jgi:hypothetical protein